MGKGGRRKRKRKTPIPEPTLPKNKPIVFSFEYYDTTNDKYCLSSWAPEQIKKALKRLKEINTKSFNELLHQGSRVYHFGEVIWEKTVKKVGFPDSRVSKFSAFHFALLGVNQQRARVYGAYNEGVFYIVWFDLNHEIWPTFLKHT